MTEYLLVAGKEYLRLGEPSEWHAVGHALWAFLKQHGSQARILDSTQAEYQWALQGREVDPDSVLKSAQDAIMTAWELGRASGHALLPLRTMEFTAKDRDDDHLASWWQLKMV